MRKALMFLIAIGTVACTNNEAEVRFNSTLRHTLKPFESCAEIDQYVAVLQEQRNRNNISFIGGAPMLDNVSASEPVAENSNDITNVQEAGADEAGTVKVSNGLIITANNKNLQVIDRNNLSLIGTIAMDDIVARGIYTLIVNSQEFLVLVGNDVSNDESDDYCYGYCHTDDTRVKVYELNGNAMPVLYSQNVILGRYVDSRILHGDQLLRLLLACILSKYEMELPY